MLIDHLAQIFSFVLESLFRMLPYLLLTIPLAVAIRVSNASQFIRRAFVAQPLLAILLATFIGAFSPFCACSVVPLITSLLIAGVPLGPVMAFWIASPTMDPEIFLLSLGMLGPDLAVARLVATLIMSLSAGLIAHALEQRGFFKDGVLRQKKRQLNWSIKGLFMPIIHVLRRHSVPAQSVMQPAPAAAFVSLNSITLNSPLGGNSAAYPIHEDQLPTRSQVKTPRQQAAPLLKPSRWTRVGKEALTATRMIVKFMLIAFLLEALITLYVPQEAIVGLLGSGNSFAILSSALVGIPIYTTNLTALPLISGLLQQGMMPGAALAFLLAGPATTIPAMSAVYGIAKPRVFLLYLLAILISAVLLGYGYQLLLSL